MNLIKTVTKHKNIIPGLLASHALTGCDTVATCFGIGEGTMLRVLKTGMNLDLLGDVDAPFRDAMKQTMQFITSCYGQPHCDSMSEARIRVWTVRTGKPGTTNTPKLCFLPPTTEAFTDNMKRAHMT